MNNSFINGHRYVAMVAVMAFLVDASLSITKADTQWSSATYRIAEVGSDVVLAVDKNNVTTAVWRDAPAGYPGGIKSSRYEGFQWTTPITLSNSDTSAPEVVVNDSGSISAVWALHQDGDVQKSIIQARIFSGGSWGIVENLAVMPGYIESSDIAMIANEDSVKVAWIDRNQPTSLKFMEHITETWHMVSEHVLDRETDPYYGSLSHSLVVTQGDKREVIFGWLTSGRRYSLSVNAISYEGGEWGNEQRLSPYDIYTHNPCGAPVNYVLQSALHSENYSMGQWLSSPDSSGCNRILQSTLYKDGAWDTNPTALAADAVQHKLVSDNHGVMVAIWSTSALSNDNRYSGLPIRSARYENGEWSNLVDVLQGEKIAQVDFDLAADNNGNLMLAVTECSRVSIEYNNGCSGHAMEAVGYKNGMWSTPVTIEKLTRNQTTWPPYLSNPRIIADHLANYTLAFSRNGELYSKHTSSKLHTLQLTKRGVGRVVSNPEAVDCGNACEVALDAMSPISLMATAIPDSGYEFNSWAGDCQGSGKCSLVINADTQVTATFTVIPQYMLKVTRASQGSVTSLPSGIQCGGSYKDCKHDYYRGSNVNLIAQPAEGFFFKKWKGCASPNEDVCEVTMDARRIVITPVFAPLPKYTLTVKKNRLGSVMADQPGLQCGPIQTQCRAKYSSGREVTLTLKPLPGHTFGSWSGDCNVSVENYCKILIDGKKYVEANFY